MDIYIVKQSAVSYDVVDPLIWAFISHEAALSKFEALRDQSVVWCHPGDDIDTTLHRVGPGVELEASDCIDAHRHTKT